MRRQRHTKIIATLGPASNSQQDIQRLFNAGADVFRMNMSHGTHADHLARYEAIRAVEQASDRPIGVLLDLQGPKLRIGTFRHGTIDVVSGQRFTLDLSPALGDHDRVQLPHPEIFSVIQPGHTLYIDDGRIRLMVESVSADGIVTRVDVGGVMSDRKGVNVPEVHLPIAAMTDKDLLDLAFARSIGVDWIALSFVQCAADVHALRQKLGPDSTCRIIAKLEKPAALKDLDAIVQATDAVMVARGDLGVELPAEDVPIAQRRIVRACRRHGKQVVIATQMLESMIHQPAPTRAEANDVATAVYDGADAIMLSAETASGKYPAEAVAMMDRIAQRTEHDAGYEQLLRANYTVPEKADSASAIGVAIRTAADLLAITVTAAYTSSGSTCLTVARERPRSPILGLSPSLATARMLSLVWGVHSVHTADATSVEDMVDKATATATGCDYTEAGKPFIIVAGMPFGTPGSTNLMRIAWADAPAQLAVSPSGF